MVEGPVHNIWHTNLNGKEYFLRHAGSGIYIIRQWQTAVDECVYTTELLKSGVNNAKGCGFFFRNGDSDGFYILTGTEYFVFDGETVKDVAEDAYVPTTVIARTPTGGGESYEDINFLTGKRCEKFCGDSTKIYQLSEKEIESVDKIEEMNGDGDISQLEAGVDYTVDLALGTVTFTAAHATPLSGHDNIYHRQKCKYLPPLYLCVVILCYY